jgi:hypothetical protein
MNINGAMMPFGVLDQAVLDALQTQSEPIRQDALTFLAVVAPDIYDALRTSTVGVDTANCVQPCQRQSPLPEVL